VVYLQGYGKAVANGESWSVATMGAVGSVSKTITAAGVMRLEEQGELDIDDAVGDYLATANAPIGDATIRALLDHSSGIGGTTQGAAFEPTWEPGSSAAACNVSPVGCDPIFHQLAEPRLAFAQYEGAETAPALGLTAGMTRSVYSNVGYSVAGAVIDALAPEGYEAWIWNHIGGWPASDLDANNLLSLALTHTWRATDIPHRAIGYPSDAPGTTPEGWEGPSGGWMMTIGDLTRFALALNQGNIVSPATLASMASISSNVDGFVSHYGLGMFLGGASSSEPKRWHAGAIGSHRAVWTYRPYAAGIAAVGVALMCNHVPAGSIQGHALAIEDLVIGTSPVPLPLPFVPALALSQVGGRTWALDRGAARQTLPVGATLPVTALLHDIVLRASVTGAQLSLTLQEVRLNGDSATAVSQRPPIALGPASYASPWFTSRPADVALASPVGNIAVQDLVAHGAFDLQGRGLTAVSLRGALDARQLAPLLGRSPTMLCSELATTGAPCTPCRDGAPTCMAFQLDNYVGRAVTGP
jgi:CubicO group peptidase (beta-lactamase class C family)